MIYVDDEFKCHAANPDGIFREFEVPFFNGKCTAFIEGYRYVPPGETWEREDGKIFNKEMIVPWKNLLELTVAQNQYEADLAEAAAAYQEGGDSV